MKDLVAYSGEVADCNQLDIDFKYHNINIWFVHSGLEKAVVFAHSPEFAVHI